MRFWLNKLIRLLAVATAVSALTFLLLALLPGDAAFVIAGLDATPQDVENIRRDLGLDRHIVIRYASWLTKLLKGDLGRSFLTDRPVLETIAERLPITIELIIVSLLMALLLAFPAGIISAYKYGRLADRCLSALGFATLSMPSFVMALLTIYFFAIQLGWLPATGYMPLSDGIWVNLRAFILPGLSVALIEWVVLMRVLRSDLIATLQQNYILMAKAKGLPPWKILLRHALRPSSLALVTVLGLQIGRYMGEAVIVETIFALPGVGRLLVDAIYNRDYMMVQGCVLVISVAYVLINAIVDATYSWLDPRIRSGKTNVP